MTKFFLFAGFALVSLTAQAEIDVVYGVDNRLDVYQVSNAGALSLAKSTAAMIPAGRFQRTSPQSFDLKPLGTLERVENICPTQKFSQQELAPTCSGFLVGEDILVTAGHCYKQDTTPAEACKQFVWVFDYAQRSATANPTKGIPLQNIFTCKTVLAAELNSSLDFAIVKLDRKVPGRAPLKFRNSGVISPKAPLMVIGHPSGLPLKISPGGKVTNNTERTRFSTNLDTFHGNSGSAVFDSSNGLLEGILIMGKTDYVPSNPKDAKSCMVVNACDDNGNRCTAGIEGGAIARGEVVLRIEMILPLLKKFLTATP